MRPVLLERYKTVTEQVKRYALKAGTNIGEWDLSLPLDPEVRKNLEGFKLNEILAACDEEWARIQAEESVEEETTPEPKAYADMTNAELVAEAKSRNDLKITGKPSRDDLIKLLEADDAKAE